MKVAVLRRNQLTSFGLELRLCLTIFLAWTALHDLLKSKFSILERRFQNL
jgi:hypothetical protein